MATDVKKIIAAINPDLYCEKSKASEVKKVAKEKGYLAAAKIAELRPSDYADIYHIQATKGVFSFAGLRNPIESHKLIYDAFSQSLEQIYFWILDYVNDRYGGSEKLIDNFISSVGGGHFAEMQGRATRMQEEAMKIFGTANTVLRSIMNIVYDLKEFKLRLSQYADYHSKDERVKHAALLALKQIWLDSVDIKRGNSSIKGMAQQFDYVTIIDAFFAVNSTKDIAKVDLNDRVKRILEQRIAEFEKWIELSEKELNKRFEIEKIYLKSQINSIRLYARWAKPYLKAAQQLEQNLGDNSSVVNAFNTAVFELVMLAKGKYDPTGDIKTGELPEIMKNMKLRKYIPIAIVEFRFRTAPERFDQKGGYGFRGRVEVQFTSFALNEEEYNLLKELVAEDDFGDIYEMISGATEKSLGELKEDIDEILGDGQIAVQGLKEKKKSDDKGGDDNPFSALFSFAAKGEKKKDKSKGIAKDSDYEKALRNQAVLGARISCRKLYNDYKKAHGMPGFPPTVNL